MDRPAPRRSLIVISRTTLSLASLALLAACAGQQLHNDGMGLLQSGKVAEGLQSLRKATEAEPSNARYRIDYLAQRALATQGLLGKAEEARTAGRLEEAAQRYREALALDDGNERAQRGLVAVSEQRKADAAIAQAEKFAKLGQFDAALDTLRRGSKDLPSNGSIATQLRLLEERLVGERAQRDRQQLATSPFRKPVTLQFREANLKMVFEALARAGGLNVILDRDVKGDQKTSLYVRDASVEDTIEVLLLQNQLEKRVLNQNTLFVYPAVAAKQKEYNELRVRSFQINNIEAAFAANLIKTLLKTKDIVTDARTNTVVMRDTPDAIAVAEKIIAANDVPDPEVMLEVEVLEVSADRISSLGIKWPDGISLRTPSAATTYGDLGSLTRNDLLTSGLGISLNLLLQDTDTNILASPRIRTRHKEKARILVGDKVPVITNLISPQSSGTNSVITGSIQYVDVGIKLEVEPNVYADGDVGIKLNLEVSNIAKTITTDSGIAYQIGTRSAQTSLRLHDGETQVLAGLINDQDRSTASKVPGLGQVPLLGKLFSSTSGSGTKSEIVLSITPRIIRPQTQPDALVGDVWSGTEAVVRERQLRLDPVPGASSTRPMGEGAIAPAAPTAVPSLPSPNPGGAATLPAPQPATAPKAGGAGGSSILGAGRTVDGQPAEPLKAGTSAAGAGGTGSAGATSGGASAGSATAGTVGTGTAPVSPRVRRPAPPSIQPGRAMSPSQPSQPAGTAAPPAPPPAAEPSDG